MKEWDTAALRALRRKYPRHYARAFKGNLTLRMLIDELNGGGLRNMAEVLRGLLAGLANPRTRLRWVILIHALSLESHFNVGRCQICEKFFLRVRKDQKCCSHKCANLFRTRKWRGKYQESYKPQRIKHAESAKGEKP